MAEIELHVLNGQCLNRHINTFEKIEKETMAWQNNRKQQEQQNKWAVYKRKGKNKIKNAVPINYKINITLVVNPEIPRLRRFFCEFDSLSNCSFSFILYGVTHARNSCKCN